MLPKIGFSLQAQYDRPLTQVVALLKNAGFFAVSPIWSAELDLKSLADAVCGHGMIIQSLHAPRKNPTPLWQPESPESADVLASILQSLDACAQFHIPMLVMHGWQGLQYTFPETPLDFRHFDRIVDHACKSGVRIAFENLEGEEYLNALLTRYRDCSHIGFCWDSGHDHCYPHQLDFLKAYGDRLIMTHLNDNFGVRDPSGIPAGTDDLHFLPYDGSIDWAHVLRRLTTASAQAILNFELKLRTKSTDDADLPYLHLPLEVFLNRAGSIAHQIAEEYANIKKQA